ncbi:isoprenylcysteine carboxyl methyltransferase [Paracoccus aminophilus JCM 7686]|uniref:Isoprenylcysteine carboxyl methyltransferase n=1 Tax=Paracoccus aminophilus JCM 7686 TaxID=1367847 RepID=S5XU59_PARAH|nr:isoprenylcysteine carboxyl methyltransferase [Paracoccus aminophilus JCM 7686]
MPQVWLAVCVAAGIGLGQLLPLSLPPILRVLGFLLFGAGAALMVWAAGTMRRAGTTFMPDQTPDHLVTRGPFAFSRNPIYLGDLLVLASLMLALDCAAGLLMVPILGVILDRAFIRKEEETAAARFGPLYDSYRARVRRWL